MKQWLNRSKEVFRASYEGIPDRRGDADEDVPGIELSIEMFFTVISAGLGHLLDSVLFKTEKKDTYGSIKSNNRAHDNRRYRESQRSEHIVNPKRPDLSHKGFFSRKLGKFFAKVGSIVAFIVHLISLLPVLPVALIEFVFDHVLQSFFNSDLLEEFPLTNGLTRLILRVLAVPSVILAIPTVALDGVFTLSGEMIAGVRNQLGRSAKILKDGFDKGFESSVPALFKIIPDSVARILDATFGTQEKIFKSKERKYEYNNSNWARIREVEREEWQPAYFGSKLNWLVEWCVWGGEWVGSILHYTFCAPSMLGLFDHLLGLGGYDKRLGADSYHGSKSGFSLFNKFPENILYTGLVARIVGYPFALLEKVLSSVIAVPVFAIDVIANTAVDLINGTYSFIGSIPGMIYSAPGMLYSGIVGGFSMLFNGIRAGYGKLPGLFSGGEKLKADSDLNFLFESKITHVSLVKLGQNRTLVPDIIAVENDKALRIFLDAAGGGVGFSFLNNSGEQVSDYTECRARDAVQIINNTLSAQSVNRGRDFRGMDQSVVHLRQRQTTTSDFANDGSGSERAVDEVDVLGHGGFGG